MATLRKRGRPATENPATPGERMKKMRAAAIKIASDPSADISAASDTGLLEALRVAYRQRQVDSLRRIMDELLRRAEGDLSYTNGDVPRPREDQ